MKLSIVISTLDRTIQLDRTLFSLCKWQNYEPADVELVVVVDRTKVWGDFGWVMRNYRRYFYKITLIEINSDRMSQKGVTGNPSLGINIAVKAAENEIILKTDAECTPITETVSESIKLFDENKLWFFCVRMLTERETEQMGEGFDSIHPDALYKKKLTQIDGLWYITERQRYPYWFGAVFSRQRFMEIGGLDEEFMKGFAGEDDEWAERMARNGVRWDWSATLKILHQYHGDWSQRWIHTEPHFTNIRRLQWSRDNAVMRANEGLDWGSDKYIIRKETFNAHR